jgi:hypothetical protein
MEKEDKIKQIFTKLYEKIEKGHSNPVLSSKYGRLVYKISKLLDEEDVLSNLIFKNIPTDYRSSASLIDDMLLYKHINLDTYPEFKTYKLTPLHHTARAIENDDYPDTTTFEEFFEDLNKKGSIENDRENFIKNFEKSHDAYFGQHPNTPDEWDEAETDIINILLNTNPKKQKDFTTNYITEESKYGVRACNMILEGLEEENYVEYIGGLRPRHWAFFPDPYLKDHPQEEDDDSQIEEDDDDDDQIDDEKSYRLLSDINKPKCCGLCINRKNKKQKFICSIDGESISIFGVCNIFTFN